MRRNLTIALFLTAILGLGSCGDSTTEKAPLKDSSTVGPTPDNNSATNPSLADTSYEKNRTRPITDTMKKK